jgi:hypothetical protein
MIDTDKYEAMELEQMIHDAGYPEWNDKYEGYTKGKWTWLFNDEVPIHLLCVSEGVIGIGVEPDDNVSEADMRLIADAPLLLAEVIRLRKQLSEAEDVIQYALDMTSDDDAKSVFEDFLEVSE